MVHYLLHTVVAGANNREHIRIGARLITGAHSTRAHRESVQRARHEVSDNERRRVRAGADIVVVYVIGISIETHAL